MAITYERFAQGMTVDVYKAQMTRNRETFEANEQSATIRPEDRDFFGGLSETLNVLIITEDWCGDAIANVPVLGRLAQETGALNLRLFLRDKNLDLADQYLKEGKFRSVPVFVFFDQQMRELGHFIERPAQATAEMQESRKLLAGQYPELADTGKPLEDLSESTRKAYLELLGKLRTERKDAWTNLLLDDIKGSIGSRV